MNSFYIASLVAVFSVIVSVGLFFRVIKTGKACGKQRIGAVTIHKVWVDIFLWSLIIPVGSIEYIVRNQSSRSGISVLLLVHFLFVAYFLVTLVCMRKWFNGILSRKRHLELFKHVIISFVLVFITGGMLWVNIATARM